MGRLGFFGCRRLVRLVGLVRLVRLDRLVRLVRLVRLDWLVRLDLVVRLFWFVRLVRLFSNLDGFLQSIAHMNDITLQVAVSSVFNNTVKLHKSVQLFHKNPKNVRSIRSPLPVNVSSVKILITTET